MQREKCNKNEKIHNRSKRIRTKNERIHTLENILLKIFLKMREKCNRNDRMYTRNRLAKRGGQNLIIKISGWTVLMAVIGIMNLAGAVKQSCRHILIE